MAEGMTQEKKRYVTLEGSPREVFFENKTDDSTWRFIELENSQTAETFKAPVPFFHFFNPAGISDIHMSLIGIFYQNECVQDGAMFVHPFFRDARIPLEKDLNLIVLTDIYGKKHFLPKNSNLKIFLYQLFDKLSITERHIGNICGLNSLDILFMKYFWDCKNVHEFYQSMKSFNAAHGKETINEELESVAFGNSYESRKSKISPLSQRQARRDPVFRASRIRSGNSF